MTEEGAAAAGLRTSRPGERQHELPGTTRCGPPRPPAATRTGGGGPVKPARRTRRMREMGLLLDHRGAVRGMSFASPYFLTWDNVRAMLLSFSIEGIVVVGMTILLIVGGIDLSVGSVVCFAMVVTGQALPDGRGPVDGEPGGHRRKRAGRRDDRRLRHAHRAEPLHRLAGLHGDRARPVPGAHAGHAAVAVLAACASSSSSARARSSAFRP